MSVEFYGKTIFVTGAAGCAGKALLTTLLKEGWTVKALAASRAEAAKLASKGAEAAMGDLTDAASLQRAMQGAHFVFYTHGPDDSHSPTAEGQPPLPGCARAAAEAALRAGVERFIYLSDSIVYGYNAKKDTSEISPVRAGGDPVVGERVKAEQAVMKAAERGLDAVILQPTTIYGPHANAWTVRMVELVRAGELTCPNQGRGLLQPIYVHDVVDGMLAAALVGKRGEKYILAGPDVIDCQSFLDHYAMMMGLDGVEVSGRGLGGLFHALKGKPQGLDPWQARCASMQATYNAGKAYYELGFLPRCTVETGMRLTEAWLRRSGILTDAAAAQPQGWEALS